MNTRVLQVTDLLFSLISDQQQTFTVGHVACAPVYLRVGTCVVLCAADKPTAEGFIGSRRPCGKSPRLYRKRVN